MQVLFSVARSFACSDYVKILTQWDRVGSSAILSKRFYALPSHSPRIRYIYRAAKTSEKLPNTLANNEPVLYDCECFSSRPRQISLPDFHRGT